MQEPKTWREREERKAYDGDLGDFFGGHGGLIEENAAEMIAIRKDIGLGWEIGTARVD